MLPEIAVTVIVICLMPESDLSHTTKAIYRTAKSVVGTKRMRFKYWVYVCRVEVDRIIAERKVAGNTRETQEKARRELAIVKGRWWESRADHLQRAADEGDTRMVRQLLDESLAPPGGDSWHCPSQEQIGGPRQPRRLQKLFEPTSRWS